MSYYNLIIVHNACVLLFSLKIFLVSSTDINCGGNQWKLPDDDHTEILNYKNFLFKDNHANLYELNKF